MSDTFDVFALRHLPSMDVLVLEYVRPMPIGIHSKPVRTRQSLRVRDLYTEIDRLRSENLKMRNTLRAVSRNAEAKHGTFVVSSHVLTEVDRVLDTTVSAKD